MPGLAADIAVRHNAFSLPHLDEVVMRLGSVTRTAETIVDPHAYDNAIERGKPFFDDELHKFAPPKRFGYFPAIVANCGHPTPHILEVGTWIGASLAAWDRASRGEAQFTVVDAWEPYAEDSGEIYDFNRSVAANGSVYRLFMHNITALGMKDRVTIVRGDSRSVLPAMDGAFDIAFVDGDHRYEFVKSDIENCKRLVKMGGILCGDDLELQVADVDVGLAFINTEVGNKVDISAFQVDDAAGWEYFHPGVTRAVFDCFGRKVSCYDGLWVVRKAPGGWEDVRL